VLLVLPLLWLQQQHQSPHQHQRWSPQSPTLVARSTIVALVEAAVELDEPQC
jgi:hypothetical protein